MSKLGLWRVVGVMMSIDPLANSNRQLAWRMQMHSFFMRDEEGGESHTSVEVFGQRYIPGPLGAAGVA